VRFSQGGRDLCITRIFISGPKTDPTTPGFRISRAKWWFAGTGRRPTASDFPDLGLAYSNITFHKDRTGLIGHLSGGNTKPIYHYLPIRGKYARRTWTDGRGK